MNDPFIKAYLNISKPDWSKKIAPKVLAYMEKEEKRKQKIRSAFILIGSIIGVGIICLFSSCNMVRVPAHAGEIDLRIIAQIESSGNPKAYNAKSGACGMYQFTPIAWLDVQQNFPELAKYPFTSAYEPQVARLFAKAYFALIDRYLRHFGLENTLSNQLACYNQGIGLTRKGILSKESRDYIAKYKRLLCQEKV
jgi:hypothetical protein